MSYTISESRCSAPQLCQGPLAVAICHLYIASLSQRRQGVPTCVSCLGRKMKVQRVRTHHSMFHCNLTDFLRFETTFYGICVTASDLYSPSVSVNTQWMACLELEELVAADIAFEAVDAHDGRCLEVVVGLGGMLL